MSETRTYALLEVSSAAYEEIGKALRAAGYDHAFHHDDDYGTVINMQGLALKRWSAGQPKESNVNPQHQAETRER